MTDNEKLIEEAAKSIHASVVSASSAGAIEIAVNTEGIEFEKALARVALAVFEKAHTLTDDEREAHRRVVDLWFANWRSIGKVSPALEVAIDSLEGMVSDALDAGFRRSEVPESRAENQARGRSRGKHTDAQMLYMICLALEEGLEGVASIDLPDRIIKMISEHWGTADADTSPEEAEAALAQLAPYIPDHMRAPEPQGEPSDAQAERARIIADLREWSRPLGNSPEEETLRLAIDRIERAAGGVR